MALTLTTLAADPIELVTCDHCPAAAIADEAGELGWVYDEEAGEWACEDCAHAPTTPRLHGMRAL
jgi:hypothetical protein